MSSLISDTETIKCSKCEKGTNPVDFYSAMPLAKQQASQPACHQPSQHRQPNQGDKKRLLIKRTPNNGRKIQL